MKRRIFIEHLTVGTGALGSLVGLTSLTDPIPKEVVSKENDQALSADVVIAGGGLGGCAAAMAALRNNLRVILTEETDWIGGQLSQQGVRSEEHTSELQSR